MSNQKIDLVPAEQVVQAVNAEIERLPDYLRPFIAATACETYRNVLIEHVAIPDMPLAYIVWRHVHKDLSKQEYEWWIERGGLPLPDKEPSLSAALFGMAGVKV
jgi:hypothetical protein